jgi:uncharacterized protein (DUF4213/DUF364 family)
MASTPPTTAELYVRLAERIAARLRFPRVRALHLPPARPDAHKDAEFCAIELDDGSTGFSYLLAGFEAPLHAPGGAPALAGMDALTLARRYAGTDPVFKALGFAAINALSQSLFSGAGWIPSAASGSLGDIDPERGEHIGMIGLFPPLVARVGEAGARLTVLELKPELAAEHESFRVTLDPGDLAACDKVVGTSTVLLNDTLDAVLAASRNARYFALIGPTAGCIPDPLFARGVHAVGGRRVVDGDRFRDAFRIGEQWGPFAAKYVIDRRHYPGIDWLLERVR